MPEWSRMKTMLLHRHLLQHVSTLLQALQHRQTPPTTQLLHLLLMGTSRCSMSSNLFGPYWQKGEKHMSLIVFKRVHMGGYFMFCLVFTTLVLIHLVLWVVTLKLDGLSATYLLFCDAYSSLMLMHACWITSVTIFHHAFQILHIIYQMRVWITRYRGRSPWFNSSSVHCFKSKFLTMHIFRGSSSISCNQIPQYQYLHFICLSPLKT